MIIVKQNYLHLFIKKKMNKGFTKTETELSKYNKKDKIYNKYYKNEIFDDIISIDIMDTIFDNCSFKGNIINTTITNCLFKNCDMSNTNIIECGLHYITIINSKLLGLEITDSMLKNSILENNLCTLLNIYNVNTKNVDFNNNNMSNSRIYNTKLNKVNFTNNNMLDIEILLTSLNNIDLSTNKINGIKISPNDIKGCIINTEQVYDIVNLLQINIK